MEFHEKLQQLRLQHNLTQEQLYAWAVDRAEQTE